MLNGCPDTLRVRLTYPGNAVVVVAGLPGAGKTTLIRRATSRPAIVVDTDDQRRRGGQASYVRHYGHIAEAVLGAAAGRDPFARNPGDRSAA